MKNLYNITKGQVITLWIFGVIWLVWAMNQSCYFYGSCSRGYRVWLADYVLFILPFALIFYTIGWRNSRKNQITGHAKELVKKRKKGEKKKKKKKNKQRERG